MLQVEHARNQLANKLQQMRQGLGAVYIAVMGIEHGEY